MSLNATDTMIFGGCGGVWGVGLVANKDFADFERLCFFSPELPKKSRDPTLRNSCNTGCWKFWEISMFSEIAETKVKERCFTEIEYQKIFKICK